MGEPVEGDVCEDEIKTGILLLPGGLFLAYPVTGNGVSQLLAVPIHNQGRAA